MSDGAGFNIGTLIRKSKNYLEKNQCLGYLTEEQFNEFQEILNVPYQWTENSGMSLDEFKEKASLGLLKLLFSNTPCNVLVDIMKTIQNLA